MLEALLYNFSKPVIKTYTGTMLNMDIRRYSPLPDGAKIIVANHPSTTDPFYVAAMDNHQAFILINEKLFKVPVFGKYLRRSGHIPVVPGNGKAAMDEALQRLANNETIVIFPEGNLSPREGGFGDPRTGAARLALLSGAPVIPVGIHLLRGRVRSIITHIEGKEEEGRWYFHGPYYMTVGLPIPFHGNVDDHNHVRQISKIIMSHIRELAFQSEDRHLQGPFMSPLKAFF